MEDPVVTLIPPRSDPIRLDLEEPICPDAAAFSGWINVALRDILEKPTPDRLEVARLWISDELYLRERLVSEHTRHCRQICLRDVWREWMGRLLEKQRSLCQVRLYEPAPQEQPKETVLEAVPAIYLGERA